MIKLYVFKGSPFEKKQTSENPLLLDKLKSKWFLLSGKIHMDSSVILKFYTFGTKNRKNQMHRWKLLGVNKFFIKYFIQVPFQFIVNSQKKELLKLKILNICLFLSFFLLEFMSLVHGFYNCKDVKLKALK